MNAKIILQRLAVEEDARNNYTTFTACGDGYRAAANVFTESADVTGHIEDGSDYVAFFVDPSKRTHPEITNLFGVCDAVVTDCGPFDPKGFKALLYKLD